MRYSKQDFVTGQGCADVALYSALMFQPRVIASLVAVGIVFEAPAVFAALGATLAWSTLLPRLNPFDALYSLWSGNRRIVAPAPRRFAQGMAATMMTGIAVAMWLGATHAAFAMQGLLSFSVAMVVGMRSCIPSNVYMRFIAAGYSRNTSSCVAQ
jgi:hypothetical protein